MNGQYTGPTVLLIILGCFALGFWIVSRLMKKYPRRQESQEASPQGERRGRQHDPVARAAPPTHHRGNEARFVQ